MGISAVAGAFQTRKNAKSQEKATKAASLERAKQLSTSASIKANDRIRAARRARAKLKASAAESGVEGTSINSLLNNEDFQAGMDVSHIRLDNNYAIDANTSATQSNLNSIQQPNYLATGLQLAGIVARSKEDKP
jgi:hypothetical protein